MHVLLTERLEVGARLELEKGALSGEDTILMENVVSRSTELMKL
jgi:hypothetical protein